MGKRTRGAQAQPAQEQPAPSHVYGDDTSDSRLAKKQRKLAKQQPRAGVDPAQALHQGADSAQGLVAQQPGGQQDQADDAVMDTEEDEASRARRKAERKAAKKAAKALVGVAQTGEGASSSPAPAEHTNEDDERARKQAKKEAKKAAKEVSGEMEVEHTPAVPSTTAQKASVSSAMSAFDVMIAKKKKDKQRKKEKTVQSEASVEQPHQHPYNGPTDPALAGLLSEIEAHVGNASSSDIPVHHQQPFSTGSSSFANDIPVNSGLIASFPSTRRDDIPVDPVLLAHASNSRNNLPAPSSSSSSSAAAFIPTDPSLAVPDARAIATARALAIAQEQERAAAETAKTSKKSKDGKGKEKEKKDKAPSKASSKGKAKAIEPVVESDDDLFRLPVPPAHFSDNPPIASTSAAAAAAPAPVPAKIVQKAPPRAKGDKLGPPGFTGDFYEQLTTKWLPVKEIKKLAEEQGATYKLGKYSAAEDEIITSTLDAFRERQGLSQAELVTLMTTKRDSSSKKTKDGSVRSAAAKAAATQAGHLANEGWHLIGRALGDRSLLSIYNHVKRLLVEETGVSTGAWTAEEDAALKKAHKELGNQWEEIGKQVGTRNGSMCRDRWVKQLAADGGKSVKKGRWEREEEEELRKWHKELGGQWGLISKKMGGTRTSTQCRTKWTDFISRRDEAAASAPSPIKETQNPIGREAWRWKPEHASTLVHAVVALSPSHESEIDWKLITHPDLALHGNKNLRDRFRHLMGLAKTAVGQKRKEENGGKEEDEEVSFEDALAALLRQYPEPGVRVKRSYTSSKQKAAKKEGSSTPAPGTGISGVDSLLSAALVEDSDDEEDSEDDESEEEDLQVGGLGAHGGLVGVGGGGGGEYGVDPMAEFNKRVAEELAGI